jgi:hypothetical protein
VSVIRRPDLAELEAATVHAAVVAMLPVPALAAG